MSEVAEVKKPILSKTLWVNLLVAALALFFPLGRDFIASNPSLVVSGMGVVNILLRLVTKSKIQLW